MEKKDLFFFFDRFRLIVPQNDERASSDQRILGFVALTIGILNAWQMPQVIHTTLPGIDFMQQAFSIDTRIFTDLMIIGGAILLLAKDISFRWMLATTLPLQIYVITSVMSSRSAAQFKVEDIVIGIIIYRQIIKLLLLEIINNYNRGVQENADSNIGSVDPASDSWYSSSITDNTKGISTKQSAGGSKARLTPQPKLLKIKRRHQPKE